MRQASGLQAERPAALLDPDLVQASRVLRAALVRVHPSFRFEERLAIRLGLQARDASAQEAGARQASDVIAFPGARRATGRWPRNVLIGGAVASGVSIAGAAYLARRWLTRGA